MIQLTNQQKIMANSHLAPNKKIEIKNVYYIRINRLLN